MKPTIFICLFTLFSEFMIAQSEQNIHVRIPDSWMENVRTMDYEKSPHDLIIEFEKEK